MRVKICGIRNSEDAGIALRAGADAVGFLVGMTHLAEDKVDPDCARSIIGSLPPFVSRVLVTHLTDESEIVDLAASLRVDTVQIHDYVPPESVARIRTCLPACKVIKAVHVVTEAETLQMMRDFEPVSDALLLDSRTVDRLGGTGLVHDWTISAQVVRLAQVPVILAGGLTDQNVYDAVAQTRPFGVDVNSGVEVDGWKDFDKVQTFVSEARRAEAGR
ncbi:MAG: phosphoribosylanthranilate isomerase [Micrococcales bacterium]|nr:phosphoribosylanthranilate isomerase [Micrococcales bacterium]MCL2666274.1 phosphoribosylanthranilate isomerase [Micrococcales bacterium]